MLRKNTEKHHLWPRLTSYGKVLLQGGWGREESGRVGGGGHRSKLQLCFNCRLCHGPPRGHPRNRTSLPGYHCAPEHCGLAEGSPSTSDNDDRAQWWMVSASSRSSATALCLCGCSKDSRHSSSQVLALLCAPVMIKWSPSTFSEPCWLVTLCHNLVLRSVTPHAPCPYPWWISSLFQTGVLFIATTPF